MSTERTDDVDSPIAPVPEKPVTDEKAETNDTDRKGEQTPPALRSFPDYPE